jgi:tRNA modification GTPase
MKNDVVAAVATPPGRGAIGVVRISGKSAADVLNRIFSPRPGRWQSHKLYHGFIQHHNIKRDEVMAVLMRGPKS